MKSTTAISFLILFCCCISGSVALDLGSFFRSYSQPRTSSETTSSSSVELPTREFLEKEQTEEAAASDSSELYSEYRSDPDAYVYNSSSEQELADLLSLNSSSEGNDTSESASMHGNASSDASKQTEEGSSSSHDSESTTKVHDASSESSKSSEVVWTKVSTPAPGSTTVGHIAAANFTTEEKEEVVLATGEPTETFGPKTIYQKSIDWLEDEYTLSILLPVTAGVIFAITIICTIAMCRCIRRCCRRRRFRKKCLPDSVKSLNASDRARLLGDMSSDEEF